ncbi:MAG: DUF6807 family protein [Gemmataceae bacterium]
MLTFSETAEGRLFVFDITLESDRARSVFGDTKEGSFGIRVHDSLRPSEKDATVTTAEGESVAPPKKDNLLIWGKPTPWDRLLAR